MALFVLMQYTPTNQSSLGSCFSSVQLF